MKAILLRNTQQRQNDIVQDLVTLNSSSNSSKGGLTREMISTLEEKFRVSARPRNILYLIIPRVIELEVISRYHKVVRSHFVK